MFFYCCCKNAVVAGYLEWQRNIAVVAVHYCSTALVAAAAFVGVVCFTIKQRMEKVQEEGLVRFNKESTTK